MNIVKLSLSDVCTMNIDEISDREKIALNFMKGTRVIYFLNNSEFIGILTIGDYNRQIDFYLKINDDCKFIYDSDEALSQATEIFETQKKISEIAVIHKQTRQLEYVFKKKENEIVQFDYDWSLVNKNDLNKLLNKFDTIFVCGNNTKIECFKNIVGNNRVLVFDNIGELLKKVKQNDLLLYSNEYSILFKNNKCTIMTIDELYVSVLGYCTVEYLHKQGIVYYFFQSPVSWKLRKENQLYYQDGLNGLYEKPCDLDELFGDYESCKRHVTNKDYKLVRITRENNRFLLNNCTSETYNVQDNYRVVPGNPQYWDRTIYVVGTCIARGYAVDDKFTIPSLLQKKLHSYGIGNVRIVNFGGGGGMNNFSDIRDFMNMLSTDLKENDIVIHIGYNVWDIQTSCVQFENYYELSWLFNRNHKQRCFIEISAHLTPYANIIVTDYIWDQLQKKKEQLKK